MNYKSYQAWIEAISAKYPNAVIHDTVREYNAGILVGVIEAVAFDGDVQVGEFDHLHGGKVN